MSISKIANEYGRPHSPYMGNFINHLPMGQIQSFSEYFIDFYSIDVVKDDHSKATTIKECLGKRGFV